MNENCSVPYWPTAVTTHVQQRTSLTYYDKVLAAIPICLGGGIVVGLVTDVSLELGLLAGAVLSTVVIYDAVFRNPPSASLSAEAKYAAIAWHVLLSLLLVRVLF